MNGNDGRRLNKFISDSGYCSRREADAHIAEGAVTVNGQKATLGTRVNPGDVVKVGWHRIRNAAPNKADRVYIAYNKPRGITCTTDPNVAANIVDAIRHKERIYPVGRLDNQSEGLIFLTSDGDIVNKILRVGNAHEKEYVVTVDKPIKGNFAQRMAGGIPMLGTVTKPCTVNVISDTVFKITLTQGLNRQIRRMCEYLGYEVVKLKRVRIMSVKLGTLKTGEWRNLTDKEMAKIHKAIATSDNSADASAGTRKAPARKTSPRKKPGQPRGDRAAPGKARGKPGGRGTGRSGAKAKSPAGKKASGGGRRKPGRRK